VSFSKKIVIPAFFIKQQNGLWYYLKDLINLIIISLGDEDSDTHEVQVFVSNWQSSAFESFGFGGDSRVVVKKIDSNKYEFLEACFWSLIRSRVVTISPTLRPLIGLNSFFICHDFWPMMQPKWFHRSVSKCLFLFGSYLSNRIFISKSHAGKNWDDELILPNDPAFDNKASDDVFACDVVLIGVETGRKRLDLLRCWIQYAVDNRIVGRCPKIAIIGVVSDHCLKGTFDGFDVHFFGPERMFDMTPRDVGSIYLSLSCEEGFNRGAKLADHLGFNLHLSDIAVHREFFPEANFFSIQSNQIKAAPIYQNTMGPRWSASEISKTRIGTMRKILGLN